MNHRITGLYLGVFIMLCAGLPVRAESMPTVSVLGVEDFAASTNAWEKIHYQLAEALVQKAGYQPLFRQLPWNRAMAYIRDGRLDLISSLSRTPEREAYIHFIGVATHEQAGLVVRRADVAAVRRLRTLDDLIATGDSWGIQENVWYAEALNRRLKQDPALRRQLDSETSATLNLRKVQKGWIRGALVENIAATRHQLREERSRFADLAVLEMPFLPAAPVYFGISRKVSADKRARLQAAYEKLAGQQHFEHILDHWTR